MELHRESHVLYVPVGEMLVQQGRGNVQHIASAI
jgi:hypothetical protein